MKDGPEAVRRKLLEKLPVGSTGLEINKFIASITSDGNMTTGAYRDGLCEKTSVALACQFQVKEKWWGKHQTGFKLHFVLDQAGRLADVKVLPYAVWLGA
jgi:hypothetical protein